MRVNLTLMTVFALGGVAFAAAQRPPQTRGVPIDLVCGPLREPIP